ncbi:MAG: ParB/RepB/Spo0J family partition protein [Verrucomicrobiales bacterium]|nr:MAG: ParB/RepB/Spo0J family partition protein [Verrucomicrobiales bacterium]
MAKPALGRGLGALLGGSSAIANSAPVAPSPAITLSTTTTHGVPATVPHAVIPAPAPVSRDAVRRVPVGHVKPCAFQPRKDFPPDALRELSDSIREQGIVQPLIVRPIGNNFELIAGERRWRAAQLAGLTEVPVIVREADDRAVLELALIENLQRENLNAIEEALGYAQLVSQFQLTQELVATKVGKSRAVVANALRLLKLPGEVQNFIRDGRLSVGHAKVILGLANPIQQGEAAERVIKEGLNVRQAEGLIAKLQSRDGKPKPAKVSLPTDAHVANLENKIRERLGTKVSLRYTKGKGSVEISFYSDAELEGVLQALGVNAD